MRTTRGRDMRGLRLAVSDPDEAFVQALAERCSRAGWHLRQLPPATLDPQVLVGAKLNAFLLDPDQLDERGWERLRLVCAMAPELAVVICTGPSSVAERVRGLRFGVEDWVTKPCALEELMARVDAVTRQSRERPPRCEVPLRIGNLELRPVERVALIGGRLLSLTPREFDLLDLFAHNQGTVLERERIYRQVWGYTMPWGDRSVDVYVLKLRQKLKRVSAGWSYIHTYHRLGYRFEPLAREKLGPGLRDKVSASGQSVEDPVVSVGVAPPRPIGV